MNFTRTFKCYVGKKGSGKTSSMMDDLCQVLANTNMQIVGNPPILFPGLGEYMTAKYERDESWLDRITLLTELDQLRRFWYYFGQGWTVPVVSVEQWKRRVRPDFRLAYRWLPTENPAARLSIDEMSIQEIKAEVERGAMECSPVKKLPRVAYFLDELGVIYPAREHLDWVPGLTFYLDQQRKLCQELVCSTVRVEGIDKSVRDMVDEWYVMVNWGKKRKSFFRLPSVLTCAEFDQTPGRNVSPTHTTYRKLDVEGLCKTYDTAAGVGIEGGMEADKGTKPPGISWKWALLIGVGVLFLGFSSMKMIRGAVSWWKGKPAPAAKATNTVAVGPQPGAIPFASTVSGALGIPGPAPGMVKPARTNVGTSRWLTGLVVWKGQATAHFSDGSTIQPGDRGYKRLLKRNGHWAGVELEDGSFWLGQGQGQGQGEVTSKLYPW